MKILFKNKKVKILITAIMLITSCVTLIGFKFGHDSAIISNRYVQAGSNEQDIDVNSIELTAHLNKLTNLRDYEILKNEMAGSNENAIIQQALKKGIVVKQGIVIDINSLIDLYDSEGSSESKDEIIQKALKKKIIQNYGDNNIESIDIEKLKALKEAYPEDTDEEIVKTAITKEIIKGEFSYSDLKIDTDMDLNTVDISQFGSYDMNDFLSLSNIKESSVIKNNEKTIKEVGIDGGQVEAQYQIDLLKNPLPQGDDSQVPMDIVIMVDVSADENSYLANALNNNVFRNPSFVNNAPTDANIIVMPYHIDSNRRDPEYYYNQCNHNNYSDDLQQMIVKLKDDGGKQVDMSDTIDRVYNNAKIWFDEMDTKREEKGIETTSAKAILNLTGDISDEEYLKCFKDGDENKGFLLDELYNVVTIYASKYGDGNSMDDLSKAYSGNAKKLHNLSGGVDKTYYASYVDKMNEQSRNDINTPLHQLDGLSIGEKVAKDLLNSIYSRYVNTQGTLNFNLGKDIRISEDDVSGAVTSINADDEQIVSLSLSKIKLKTDYSILADQNIKVSSDFLEDLKQQIIDSTFNGKIHNEKILHFLQDRLSDLSIVIEENDVKVITDGMYDNLMNITVEQINNNNNNIICKLDNMGNYQSGILTAEDYAAVKNMRVIEILKLNYEDGSNDKYLKLYNLFADLVAENLEIKLNNAIGKKIEDAYEGYRDEKNAIVNGILNNTDVTSLVQQIRKGSSNGTATVINEIKKKFNSNSKISDITLNVRTETVETLENLGYKDKTLAEILKLETENNELKAAQEDIRSALRQLTNIPLGLTQTTYTIEEKDNDIRFIIEPTLSAVFDESKTELFFEDNKNEQNPENNFISYTSSSNSGSVTKNTAVEDTPILVLNRILTSKNHVVYKEISHAVNDYYEDVMIAKAIDEEGIDSLEFAKNSVVTIAGNIRDITGNRKIELELNYKAGGSGSEEELDSEEKLELIEVPKLYKYDYTDNQLDFIGNLVQKDEDVLKYSININNETRSDYIVLYSVKSNLDNCDNELRISGLSKGKGTLKLYTIDDLPDLY